jgi:hypothetical protein
MKIPGVVAKHAIITPNCRTVPRPHLHEDPAEAAFEEAVGRLREEYRAICAARPDEWKAHLVLTIVS